MSKTALYIVALLHELQTSHRFTRAALVSGGPNERSHFSLNVCVHAYLCKKKKERLFETRNRILVSPACGQVCGMHKGLK